MDYLNSQKQTHSQEQVKRGRGRPASFDRDELIEKITELFWTYGYKTLSFNEIARKTGLTRASLYHAFETKQNLFMEVLQRYGADSPDMILKDIRDGDSIGAAFYTMFDQVIALRTSDEKRRGCLTMNCMNELIADQDDLGPVFSDFYNQRRDFLKGLIEQAIRQQELPAETDSQITTDLLMTFMAGYNLFSRAIPDEASQRNAVHGFLQNIGFTRPAPLNS